MKTYKDWPIGKSLHEYLQVGDYVDEEMYNHFVNVMPPKMLRSNYVQMGEPYSISKEGRPTYATLEKVNGKWMYRGHCHVGENIHHESNY